MFKKNSSNIQPQHTVSGGNLKLVIFRKKSGKLTCSILRSTYVREKTRPNWHWHHRPARQAISRVCRSIITEFNEIFVVLEKAFIFSNSLFIFFILNLILTLTVYFLQEWFKKQGTVNTYGIVTFAEIELIDSGKLKNFGEFRLSVSIRLIAFSLAHLETQFQVIHMK